MAESFWSGVADKAKLFCQTIKDSDLLEYLQSLAESTKDWLKERVAYFVENGSASEQDAQTVMAQLPDSVGGGVSIQNSSLTESAVQVSSGEKASFEDLSFDFSDIPDADREATEISNLATLKIISRISDENGMFDMDECAVKFAEFADYSDKYASIVEQSSDDAALEAALAQLDANSDPVTASVFQQTMTDYGVYTGLLSDMADAGASDYTNAYRLCPDAAFASGDIDVAEWMQMSMQQPAFEASQLAAAEKQEQTSLDLSVPQTNLLISFTGNESADERTALTIQNLAVLKFSRNMAREGAVNQTVLEEKMAQMAGYMDGIAKIGQTCDAKDIDSEIAKLREATDPAVLSVFDSCSESLGAFEQAYAEKYAYMSKIPDGKSQAAIMENFYQNYEDPDVVYAAGYLTKEQYTAKLDTSLAVLPDDQYQAYVSSLRAGQADTGFSSDEAVSVEK